jgi:isoquinoline 1-oxidoreductase alpha subunit
MPTQSITINGRSHPIGDLDPSTPLLWFLRDHLKLTGTKYGCGLGLCGACTVHLNGAAIRSCTIPAAAVAGQNVTTIEGLAGAGALAPIQQAWHDCDVVQCGYCQSGQIMSAAALLAQTPRPDDAQISSAMTGNLCRCGTYERIRTAIKQAAAAHHP